MDYKYINQLLEQYWDAETTLEEEEILRAFFSQAVIPADLESYRPLFVYEQQAKSSERLGDDFDERVLAMVDEPQPVKARTVSLQHRLMPLFRAAAIVAIILTLGNAAQRSFSPADEAVAEYSVEQVDGGTAVALTGDSTKIDTMRQSNLMTTEESVLLTPQVISSDKQD